MLAVEWFLKRLCEHGVEWIATLCGHGLDPLHQAAQRAGVRLIDTRNEQTASYIADRYGRLTGRPGVCAVSSGVACINALSGLANAWFDHAPMLLVSGSGPLATAGMGHFQDLDPIGPTVSLTRYSRTIDRPERVVQILDEAWYHALGPDPGPVHLNFPLDVQVTEVPEEQLVWSARPAPSVILPEDSVEEIAAAFQKATRPLIVAGGRLYHSGSATEVLRVAERWSIPVVTPIWDPGVVDQPSPVFAGVVGASTGEPLLLQEADLILVAGAEPDYRIGYLQPASLAPGARVFHLLAGWRKLEELLEAADLPPFTEWLKTVIARRKAFTEAVWQCGRRQANGQIHAIHIIEALQTVLDNRTILVIDGGAIGQWAHHLLCARRYPSYWLTPGPSGAVGYGIGGAMAARLAFPDRRVILLAGDGAFTFNATDIERAIAQQLPFVAIVADDQGWGLTREGQLQQLGATFATELGPIAFDELARSLGAWARRVKSPQEILPALEEALDAGTIAVIHVPVVGGIPRVIPEGE